MPQYRVWLHVDTGVECFVDAKDSDEAMEKGEEYISNIMPFEEWQHQVLSHVQGDDFDVEEVTD